MKILVAEDDPTFQRILGSLLTKWGHDPVISNNGKDAWEHLQAQDGPRLAILDWVMPGLNGIDVCRHVRSLFSRGYTYIIMLTAKSDPHDAATALEAGADDIVCKPFDSQELRARIKTAERILTLEAGLLQRANYDHLTGLANRTLLEKRFQEGTELAQRTNSILAVLYVDLDRFKMVNDSLGHAAGDVMLQDVATRLNSCLTDNETLARVGGDEFVCLANVASSDAAEALVAKFRSALAPEPDGGRNRFSTSASIGISLFPKHGETFDLLLQRADSAMYESKRLVPNNHQIFNLRIGERHQLRLMLETNLPGALARHEFLLHYQPIFRLSDLRMVGSEALIRWNDPLRGLVSPAEFIPIAEEIGSIATIGEWVLEQACRQAKQWAARGEKSFRVAVNISGSQFCHDELIDTVSGVLSRTGVDASLIELEMTETALVRDLEKSAKIMVSLRELGVRVALDDFGTGYSSFSYLASLPINTLKIDRSFLMGIHRSGRRASVLESIVALAHKLGIVVVAEGIEDENQLSAVEQAGCDEVQGFFFAKPGLPERIQHHQRPNPVHARTASDLYGLARQLEPVPLLV